MPDLFAPSTINSIVIALVILVTAAELLINVGGIWKKLGYLLSLPAGVLFVIMLTALLSVTDLISMVE